MVNIPVTWRLDSGAWAQGTLVGFATYSEGTYGIVSYSTGFVLVAMPKLSTKV